MERRTSDRVLAEFVVERDDGEVSSRAQMVRLACVDSGQQALDLKVVIDPPLEAGDSVDLTVNLTDELGVTVTHTVRVELW